MVRQRVESAVNAVWVLQPARPSVIAIKTQMQIFAKEIAGPSSYRDAAGSHGLIVDITFQLLDDEFFFVQHFLHDIAN